MIDIRTIAQEIRPVIYKAGEIAMKYFRNVSYERKKDHSVVTAADREIEKYLRQEITERYPEHGFIGEETGKHRIGESEYVWAVDPIDGTEPFVCELPVWCISIGLVHPTGPKLGFVYLPVINELYWAVEGEPAYLNDRIIQVAEPAEFTHQSSIITSTVTYPRYFEVKYPGRTFAFGSAAANICFVARGGKIQGGLLDYIRIYDIAGAAMVLKSAGGVLRFLSGGDMNLWDMTNGEKATECAAYGHPASVEQLRTFFIEKKEKELRNVY